MPEAVVDTMDATGVQNRAPIFRSSKRRGSREKQRAAEATGQVRAPRVFLEVKKSQRAVRRLNAKKKRKI